MLFIGAHLCLMVRSSLRQLFAYFVTVPSSSSLCGYNHGIVVRWCCIHGRGMEHRTVPLERFGLVIRSRSVNGFGDIRDTFGRTQTLAPSSVFSLGNTHIHAGTETVFGARLLMHVEARTGVRARTGARAPTRDSHR